MKRVLLFLLICTELVFAQGDANPNLFRLAFFNLESQSISDTAVAEFENELKKELVGTGLFTMIPHQEITIAEKKGIYFDRGKARYFIKMGERVGADKVLFGSIEEVNRVYKLSIHIMDATTRKLDREIDVYRDADPDSLNSIAPAVAWRFFYPNDRDGYSDKSIRFYDDIGSDNMKIYKIATPVFMGAGFVGALIGKRVIASDFDGTSTLDSTKYEPIKEDVTNNRAVFDITGFSAKAASMAEAVTATGGGGATGFIYNPATLPYIESRSASASYVHYTGFDDNYGLERVSLAYSDRIKDNHYFGNAIFFVGGDGLMSEMTIMTGYGIGLKNIWVLPDFTLGGNFKFRSLRFGEGENSNGDDRVRGNAWGVGLDIGGTAHFTKELRGGMVLSDFVNYLSWNNSLTDRQYNEPLPSELKMGLAYTYNSFFTFNLDWHKSIYESQSEAFAFGLDWAPYSFLSLRGGWFQDAYQYDRNKATAGAGISHMFNVGGYGMYNVSIDYAFEYLEILYNTHTFTLGVEF